jgi:membrane protein implicated in regulation of membrane protease activity
MILRITQSAALVLGIEAIIVFFLFPSVIFYAFGIAAGVIILGFALLIVSLILLGPLIALLNLANWISNRPASLSGLQRRAEADAPSKGGKHDEVPNSQHRADPGWQGTQDGDEDTLHHH